MLNKILLILFILLSYSGFSIDRAEECKKLLAEGKCDLVIKWLEPYVKSGNFEPSDYSFLIAAYRLKNDNFNALDHSNKWFNISLEKCDTSGLISALGYKMDILHAMGDLEGSITSAELALDLLRPSDSINKAVFNTRLGIYQWENKNIDLAYSIYSKINFEHIALAHFEASYYNNFGVIYDEVGLLDSSIYCFRKAINYSADYNTEQFRALQYSNLAVNCIKVKKYDLALGYLDTAASLTPDHDHSAFKMVYKNYFELYYAQKMADSALVYVLKIDELNNKLFSERMNLETQELKDQYEKEIQLKTKIILADQQLEESRLQLLLSIIGILFILVIAAGIILFLRYRNLKASRNNLLTRQQLLRSQITPHFLYNALSTIQGMILKKENKLASSYLSKFSKLVRMILKNSRDKVVSLSDELQAIKYYLDLHNARFSEMIDYSIDVETDIEGDSVLIPPMLIQPFVENCIEHGFKNIDWKRAINIHVYFDKKTLVCKITDNGVGVNTKPQETIVPKKESISTGITMERMQLLAKDFKSKTSIKIIDRSEFQEKGTIVILEIPHKYD